MRDHPVFNGLLLLATIVVVASFAIIHHPKQPLGATSHPVKTLKTSFRGIPAGTTLDWNNGKYVPTSVPGYESKADYPDSFWIYDTQSLTAANSQ